jgi:hypothetical protein
MTDFTPGDNCVIHHTPLGDRTRSREWVDERLADWRTLHDELLRGGKVWQRLDAREIAALIVELQFVGSCVWPETPDTIPELNVINLTIRTLDPRRWPAVPGPEAA